MANVKRKQNFSFLATKLVGSENWCRTARRTIRWPVRKNRTKENYPWCLGEGGLIFLSIRCNVEQEGARRGDWRSREHAAVLIEGLSFAPRTHAENGIDKFATAIPRD